VKQGSSGRRKETEVRVELAVDGAGESTADTGIPFFDHMLQQLGTHAGFDLSVTAKGDLEVDAHHTVEDVGLVIGQALAEALGKTPEVSTRVDPSLLGGLKVRVGSRLFDASLRSKLDSLKFALKRA